MTFKVTGKTIIKLFEWRLFIQVSRFNNTCIKDTILVQFLGKTGEKINAMS